MCCYDSMEADNWVYSVKSTAQVCIMFWFTIANKWLCCKFHTKPACTLYIIYNKKNFSKEIKCQLLLLHQKPYESHHIALSNLCWCIERKKQNQFREVKLLEIWKLRRNRLGYESAANGQKYAERILADRCELLNKREKESEYWCCRLLVKRFFLWNWAQCDFAHLNS